MMRIVRYIIIVISFGMMCFELYRVFTTEYADLTDYKNYWKAIVFAIIILVGFWGNYKDKKAQERMEKYRKRYDDI